MADKLRMDYINSLPQPLLVRFCGDSDKYWWPVIDIDVETGLTRIDVCGLSQVTSFGEVMCVKDANLEEYDPETFYNEENNQNEHSS